MSFCLRSALPQTGGRHPTPTPRGCWSRLCTAGLALWCAVVASATTVIPPGFDVLVNQSDYIVRSRVKNVSTEKRPSAQGVKIVTRVELEILELVAGSPPPSVTLEMLGGKVGDEELMVEGMPRFVVGDEDILFVRDNGRSICPLYAMMHGRYAVRHDLATDRKYLVRADEIPLRSPAQISAPLSDHATVGARGVADPAVLGPDEFIRQIRAAVKPDSRLNRAK